MPSRDSSPHHARRASTPALRDVGAVSAALQLSPLPTFMVDADGVVHACNELFAQEAGVPQTLLLGREWWEAFARASAEAARAAQRVVTGEPLARGSALLPLTQADGTSAVLSATWQRVTEPGTHRHMWIIAITSWQRPGAQRGDAPAHDSPAGPELALVAADEIADALAHEGDAAEALRRARATVAGLRRFARAPGEAPATLRLGDAARAALSAAPAPGGPVRFTDESRTEFQGPRGEFAHAVALLIRAASVHAPGGAPLAVRTYDEPGFAGIEVRAESAGISPEEVTTAAGAFFAGPGGASLALAVARAAVRALGGTLRTAAEPGGALTLSATFATRPAAVAATAPRGARPAALGACAVLLVDDEPVLVRALGRLIESAGARVALAATAAEALQAVGAETFDAVVVDVHLPDGDGLSVARRAVERDARTCVVVVTGHSDPALERLATTMGARAVLEKPFEPARLIALLRDLLAPDV